MKKVVINLLSTEIPAKTYHITLLIFRILLCSELIYAHGLKKIGVGVDEAEIIPNPLDLPAALNNAFAISANTVLPILVMFGFLTRLSVLPILSVTLTGYFYVHFNDAPLVKDTPFMFSLCFLLVFILGPGKYSVDAQILEKLKQ